MTLWNSEGLWAKAKHFTDIANAHEQNSSNFALYSALGLECLARSALTRVHPALNADPREDSNLLCAFGFKVSAKPRSLPAHSVYIRLEKIIPDFLKQHRELCEFLALLRNSHLHSEELPFENLMPSKWLPRYYDTVSILNLSLGKTLSEFVGVEAASSAASLVKALNDEVLKAVSQRVAAHKAVWNGKADEEKATLAHTALAATAILNWGEVMRPCPVCGSNGTLRGTQVKVFPEKYEDEELTVDVEFLSDEFKCVACGFFLKSTEEVAHTDLPTHFIESRSTNLHELYEHDYQQEYDNM